MLRDIGALAPDITTKLQFEIQIFAIGRPFDVLAGSNDREPIGFVIDGPVVEDLGYKRLAIDSGRLICILRIFVFLSLEQPLQISYTAEGVHEMPFKAQAVAHLYGSFDRRVERDIAALAFRGRRRPLQQRARLV